MDKNCNKKWLWLDRNIKSRQNQILLQTFHLLHINVQGFEKYVDLKLSVCQNYSQKKEPSDLYIICSSTLSAQTYRLLEKQIDPEGMVIYCSRRQNGIKLQKFHKKIQRVFTKDNQLINYLSNGYS